jgi:hypothetical protein
MSQDAFHKSKVLRGPPRAPLGVLKGPRPFQYKLAKGIMLGGFGSIIAVDLAELCFCALDPITSKGIEIYDSKVRGVQPKMGSAVGSSGVPSGTMSHSGAPFGAEEEKEKNRKNIWKRVFRITLLLLVAFIALSFLKEGKGEGPPP